MKSPTTSQPPSSSGNWNLTGYLRFALSYWTGPDARTAWLLTGAIAAIIAATLVVNLGLNYWNRWFFDAVEKKDAAQIWSVLLWLPVLIIGGAAIAVLNTRTRMTLQVRWREFVTGRMLALWLENQRYYRLSLAQRELDNAEHRIAEDVRLATEPMVEMTVGFIWSVSSALAFIGVLVAVGGSAVVLGVTVPGYMAIAAGLYAVLVCGATMLIGQPLAGRVAAKNETEAQFRYELTRVRENAESIALMHGDAREQAQTSTKLKAIISAWLDVIRLHARLTWVSNGNAFLAPIVPALLAAPKYLAGEISLGVVMQLIAAFGAVLGALNWIADNYVRLAELSASASRVEQLRGALVALDDNADASALPSIAVGTGTDSSIELLNVTLKKSDGAALVRRANLRILAGQRVLIEGKSGSGKSTLLRALAGLWPWGAGQIRLPAGSVVAFVPQRPYIPLGKLRDALIYPHTETTLEDTEIITIFNKIGLDHFIPKLGDSDAWDRILSGGERQRLAFGRLLVQRPDIIVLDEATSALDDEGQHKLFALLTTELPDATILNVAHRKGLEEFHDRKIRIEASASGPFLSINSLRGRASGLLNKFRKRTSMVPTADELDGLGLRSRMPDADAQSKAKEPA